jgi:hypothetical protein
MRAAANIGDKRIAINRAGNNSKNALDVEAFKGRQVVDLRSIKVPFCSLYLPIPARI